VNAAIRQAVFERDQGICRYCGCEPRPYEQCFGWKRTRKMSGWEVDHVVPKSRGGSDELENLVLACAWCNRRKHANEWTPNPLPWEDGADLAHPIDLSESVPVADMVRLGEMFD
jgi:5-methylcytosine-specific restriction endonuclease McrA